MRTAGGMIRSGEVMRNKKPIVARISVEPKMGGGVTVTNHHHAPHPETTHEFGPEAGNAFHDHMEKHTGLSYEPEDEENEESANGGAENEIAGGDSDEE